MKYQVVLELPCEAVVKTTYLNKNFSYVFLGITCDPAEHSSMKKSAKRKYTFVSSALLPPLPVGDPRRFKIIRQHFHGESDINVTIEATSLQEACNKFATPYNDVFEVIDEVKHPKYISVLPGTRTGRAKSAAAG